jgi:predicted RNase H-like HicB family nuclease
MDYLLVIEKANDGSFSAYVPDLPGCVSCGDTEDEVRQLIQEAVALHLEAVREQGEPIPPPSAKPHHVQHRVSASNSPLFFPTLPCRSGRSPEIEVVLTHRRYGMILECEPFEPILTVESSCPTNRLIFRRRRR